MECGTNEAKKKAFVQTVQEALGTALSAGWAAASAA